MRTTLESRNILITGASSGIGAECCRVCADNGANVILLGRDSRRLEETLKSLKPGSHYTISCDLMNIQEIEQAIVETLNKAGKIYGFIHSAGIDVTRPLSSLRYEDYLSVFNTNVISGFEIARIISRKQFCPPDGASYIFIASVMGIVGVSGKIAYSASKGAIVAGCKSMALELTFKNIRVNCVSPAIVRTELVDNLFAELPADAVNKIKSEHPIGLGLPDDIAKACLYLLSEDSKWVTGSNFIIDGGYTCH